MPSISQSTQNQSRAQNTQCVQQTELKDPVVARLGRHVADSHCSELMICQSEKTAADSAEEMAKFIKYCNQGVKTFI